VCSRTPLISQAFPFLPCFSLGRDSGIRPPSSSTLHLDWLNSKLVETASNARGRLGASHPLINDNKWGVRNRGSEGLGHTHFLFLPWALFVFEMHGSGLGREYGLLGLRCWVWIFISHVSPRSSFFFFLPCGCRDWEPLLQVFSFKLSKKTAQKFGMPPSRIHPDAIPHKVIPRVAFNFLKRHCGRQPGAQNMWWAPWRPRFWG
jgi:hypothetical protein